MPKNRTLIVKGNEITIFQGEQSEYISLTDIARYKDAEHTDDIIKNWLRNRNTIELLISGKRCTIRILNPSNSTRLERN